MVLWCNISEVKELIKLYFKQGYNYRLIHYLLESRHQYTISFSYLQKKIIPSLGLKRRGALSADIADIFTISVNEVNNGVAGAEQLRRTLSMKYQLQIPRQLSREVVRVIDPDGLERRKKHRLRRRQYFSKGPNYAWHLDGYDKLGPYGVYIHGCIDGFSRKVVWLKAGVTNRRPEVVGQYFVEAVVNEGGFPKRVRGDNGSENGLVARIQREVLDDESAYRYGTSTSNQDVLTVCIHAIYPEAIGRDEVHLEQPSHSESEKWRCDAGYPRYTPYPNPTIWGAEFLDCGTRCYNTAIFAAAVYQPIPNVGSGLM